VRRTNRVGEVPSDAADVATFRCRRLIRPETVELWPDISDYKVGRVCLSWFLVVANWR